jgi:hypothetical protein
MSPFEELLAATALTSFANQAQPFVSSSNKDSQTGKKTKGSRFPVQLMKLLECGKYDHIISWSPEGRSFVVYNPALLVKEALPLFFETPLKYTSFTRKLHRWGFVKVSSNSFFNPKFRRGDLAGAASLSCHKGNTGRDVPSTNVSNQFRVISDVDKRRISPDTVQGPHYFPISSMQLGSKSPASFNTTNQPRMPSLVPESTFGTANAGFPSFPNLQQMGQGGYDRNSAMYPRDRDAILSLASRYDAIRHGLGGNFGHSFESPYINKRNSHADDLLRYFANQRAQHNLLIRNAWKAFKANEGHSTF